MIKIAWALLQWVSMLMLIPQLPDFELDLSAIWLTQASIEKLTSWPEPAQLYPSALLLITSHDSIINRVFLSSFLCYFRHSWSFENVSLTFHGRNSTDFRMKPQYTWHTSANIQKQIDWYFRTKLLNKEISEHFSKQQNLMWYLSFRTLSFRISNAVGN